jgi:DNA (cytosine-5)-methyltransferase 1
MSHKFPYKWYLKDEYPEKNGLKVFSCFACGGGSTMGYKLAGYEVLGANEIDPKMAECYKVNHNPKYLYVEPIQEFKLREDLPEELYHLDILDGSPPCSSFSMAGNREKDWGKEKKFSKDFYLAMLKNMYGKYIKPLKKPAIMSINGCLMLRKWVFHKEGKECFLLLSGKILFQR